MLAKRKRTRRTSDGNWGASLWLRHHSNSNLDARWWWLLTWGQRLGSKMQALDRALRCWRRPGFSRMGKNSQNSSFLLGSRATGQLQGQLFLVSMVPAGLFQLWTGIWRSRYWHEYEFLVKVSHQSRLTSLMLAGGPGPGYRDRGKERDLTQCVTVT